MNTKIIVALVLAIVLVGLTGVASAGYSSYTDMRGSHLSSTSQTSVSGMPVTSHYTQQFSAKLNIPIWPQSDFCNTDMHLTGDSYSTSSEIRSSPGRNTVSSTIANPSDVSGILTRSNCAMLQQGIESQEVSFPYPISEPTVSLWWGVHPVGVAEPAHSEEWHSISWP